MIAPSRLSAARMSRRSRVAGFDLRWVQQLFNRKGGSMANLTRLKSRGRDGKPSWRIQFYDGAGERRAVYLGAVPKKAADAWLNRVEQLNACVIAGVAPDTDLAAWVGSLPDSSHEKLVQGGLTPPRESSKPESITVARMNEVFVARSSGKPATIRGFQQTLDTLVTFFGADTLITSITPEGADSWRVWVVGAKEGSGRRKKKRTTEDNRLAPPTVAKRVSVAKQVFRCAVRWGWLPKSPFEGLRSGSQANPARARYVSMDTIRDVLEACPSVEWKLVIVLARHAGLRCPTEIGALTWGDINWEKGRLTVRAKKTEHHGGDHAVRVVPICPELRTILADAFDRAQPGTTLIVPMASRSAVNLRTHLERIIAKAGHRLGGAVPIARRGQVARTLAEGSGAALPHVPRPPLRGRGERSGKGASGDRSRGSGWGGGVRRELRRHCDAKCDSAGVRIRQHGVAQNDRTRCHHSGCSGFFDVCASYQNWPSGGDRIRTCDLEVMSLASYRAAPPRDVFDSFSGFGRFGRLLRTVATASISLTPISG